MKGRRGKCAAMRNNRPVLFLLPSLLGVLSFYLLPFLIILVYSFFDDPLRLNFVGLTNYASLLRNHAFLLALKNTVLFLTGAVGAALLVSLGLALLLRRLIARSGLMKAALALPLTVPVVTTVILVALTLDWYGALNGLLRGLGLSPVNWLDGVWARRSMILLYLWKHCGLFTLLMAAALGTVPQDEREAAQLDGAGWLQTTFSITIPMIKPIIGPSVIITIFTTFKQFDVIYLLTQQVGARSGSDIHTIMTYAYEKAFVTNNYGYSSAVSMLIFLMLVGFTIFTNKIGKKKEDL